MPTETASAQRTQRKARKLDRAKVLELADQGVRTPDIAKHQGVAASTVFRFLQRLQPERQALEAFKQQRGDVFDRLSAKSLDLQEAILDSFNDALIATLTPSQKSGLLMTLNVQHGTLYDKSRLERGLSTENFGVLGRVILEAEDGLGRSGKTGTTTRSVSPAQQTSSDSKCAESQGLNSSPETMHREGRRG